MEARIQIVLSDGKKAGETLKELGKDANRINRELKDLTPGTEKFVAKSKDLQQVNSRMKEVKDQINGTTQASNTLKDAFNKYVPFSGTFAKIGQELGFVKQGVGGLTGSLGILRTALVATGIGAIVVVLGSLISYLTSTQAGMDKVTAVTRPLSAIFQRLIGVVQELGGKVFKGLSDAINNPRQAFIDLGNAIKDNIINRFEALSLFGPAIAKIFSGDIAGGFKDLGNATLQLGTGVEDVIGKVTDATKAVVQWGIEGAQAGTRLDQLTKAIERQEITLARQIPKLKSEIKDLNFIVEDETRALADREAAAALAMEKQEQMLQMQISLIDKKAAKMREEQALNDTSRENELELAELEAKRYELSEQIVEARTTMRNKLNIIQKREMDEERKLQQNIENLRLEAMQEGMNKEIEQITLDTERKIEALTGSAEQIREQERLLEEIRQMDIQAVRDKYAAEQAAKDKKAKEDQEKRDKELADKQKKMAEDKANFEAELADVHRELALDSFDFATEVSGKLLKDEADARKARKAGALLEIGINLQRELAANAAAAAANPLNATTFGAAGAAQLAASNLRSIIRSAISAARVIAFRRGGVLKGPSHENNGIPFSVNGRGGFEAEGDEILLTKGVFRNPALRRAASALNVMGGGRQFESGGPLSPFADRAPVSRSSSPASAGGSGIFGFDTISAKIDQLIEAQDRRIDRIKVINVATETEDVIKTVNEIRAGADV